MTLTISPSELPLSSLISQLNSYSVAVYMEGGRVRVRLPWSPDQAQEEAIPLLRELKLQQAKVLVYLQDRQESPPAPALSSVPLFKPLARGAGQVEPEEEQPAPLYLHGHPGTRPEAEWRKVAQQDMKRFREARDTESANRAFTDASFAFTCSRYLTEKDERQRGRWFYLLENMRYPGSEPEPSPRRDKPKVNIYPTRPTSAEVMDEIKRIEPDALSLGWTEQDLWGAEFWPIQKRGLAACLRPGWSISQDTKDWIEITKVSHGQVVVQRFYKKYPASAG